MDLFETRLQQLTAGHAKLISLQNMPIMPGNGIYQKWPGMRPH